MDRFHPSLQMFQWIMDPSDPMAVARDSNVTETVLMGIGDYQVPNNTTEALVNALPAAEIAPCTPTTDDYDPHQCMVREDEGLAIVRDWLSP